jgi:hypothetical protein
MPKVKPTSEKKMERQGKAIGRIEAAAAPNCDFYASVSAEEVARSQGVQPIRRLGQIRTFSDPDPAQAEWLAREVRRWRCEDPPRAASR